MFTFMAAVAEASRVVATSALDLTALNIQSVSEIIVQLVDVAGQVVPAMTLHAGGLMLMTADTPTTFENRSVAVLVSPIVGMNVFECYACAVT